MKNKIDIVSTQHFDEVIRLIQHTRSEIVRTANSQLIELYWQLGAYMSNKIESAQWGDSVVQQLSEYIASKAPELKGFSAQNLWRMKQFYETYRSADEKLSTLLREISWSNNLTILSRTKSEEERSFYLQLCVKEHLSYRDLNRQIDSALFERAMLEKPKLSPLLREIAPSAKQVFHDQYVMEFIGGKEYKSENSMKSALVQQMKDKDNEVVEYALSRSLSPTMVAEYKLCLPDKKLLQAKMREIETK